MIALLLNGLAFAGESQGGADVPVEENIGGGTTNFISSKGKASKNIHFTVLIHLLLNRTEYYQLQIVSKKLTKMHTPLCIDVRVVLLFVNRTGKLVEMSADEKSWWW